MGEGSHGRGGGGGLRRRREEDPKPIRPGTLRRALVLFKPYRPQLIVVAVLVLVISALGVATPLLIREVIDDAIPNDNRSLLVWLVVGMIAATVATGVFNMIEVWLNVGVGVRDAGHS